MRSTKTGRWPEAHPHARGFAGPDGARLFDSGTGTDGTGGATDPAGPWGPAGGTGRAVRPEDRDSGDSSDRAVARGRAEQSNRRRRRQWGHRRQRRQLSDPVEARQRVARPAKVLREARAREAPSERAAHIRAGAGGAGGSGGRGGGAGGNGGTSTGGAGGTDSGRGRTVRHLRAGNTPCVGRPQHGARALRSVRRAALPGQARVGQDDQGHPGPQRRGLRRRVRAGHVLRRHDLHDLDHLRPVANANHLQGAAGRLVDQWGPGGERHRRQDHGERAYGPRRSTRRRTSTTPPAPSATGTTRQRASRPATKPEAMYMVASGKHYNQWCCFDYGNAETNNIDDGNGHHGGRLLREQHSVGPGQRQRALGHGGSRKRRVRRRVHRLRPATNTVARRELRHRDAQGPVGKPVRAQGRQRAVRRPRDEVRRSAPGRLQPHEKAGRDHPGDRRRQQPHGRRARSSKGA